MPKQKQNKLAAGAQSKPSMKLKKSTKQPLSQGTRRSPRLVSKTNPPNPKLVAAVQAHAQAQPPVVLPQQPVPMQVVQPQHQVPVQAVPQQAHAPNAGFIRIRIADNGKVHYYGRDDANMRNQHAAAYVDMSVDHFKTWKGAGKRYASRKLTDPVTGLNYAKNDATGLFHAYDRTGVNNLGPVANVQPNANSLIDRSRDDRVNGALQPFDVGPYASNVVLHNRTYYALPTAYGVWNANNDHVPSGASLSERDGQVAYDTGFTIAIPNPEMHRPFSPTYGGRQATRDTMSDGSSSPRKSYDALRPASAFHRDVDFMLGKTLGLDASGAHGTAQPTLDLTKPENRVRQIGAYRTLYRSNTRMHEVYPNRGVDPAEVSEAATHTPKVKHGVSTIGTFAYTAQNQGAAITRMFRDRLVAENLAT